MTARVRQLHAEDGRDARSGRVSASAAETAVRARGQLTAVTDARRTCRRPVSAADARCSRRHDVRRPGRRRLPQ